MTIRTIPLDPNGKAFIVTENVVGFSIIESNIFTASTNFKDTILLENKITEWKDSLNIMNNSVSSLLKLLKKGLKNRHFIKVEEAMKQSEKEVQRLSANIKAFEILHTEDRIVTNDKLPSFVVPGPINYIIRTRLISKRTYAEVVINDYVSTTWKQVDEHWFSKTTSYDIRFGLKSGPGTVLTRFKFPTNKDAVEYLNRNNFL